MTITATTAGMQGLKVTISPPLEAGPSLLDSHSLPVRVCQALEHISSRLASKGRHATFLLIRHDYQLPPSLRRSLTSLPTAVAPSTPTSPNPAGFLRRQLSDLASRALPVPPASPRFLWSVRRAASPAPTREEMVSTPTPSIPGTVWSGSTERSASPSSPRTPITPAMSSTDCVQLLYVPSEDIKSEMYLGDLIRKAERKFQVRMEAMSSTSAATCLILHNSIAQSRFPTSTSSQSSRALFSAEGVTVFSLDGLYAFKSALAAHGRSPSPWSLRDATDELHRLVVSRGGRKVVKADVLRSYDWLPAPAYALAEVEREYRRVYGLSGCGPFSGGGFVEEKVEEVREVRVEETEVKAERANGRAVANVEAPRAMVDVCEKEADKDEGSRHAVAESPAPQRHSDATEVFDIRTETPRLAVIAQRPLMPPKLRALRIQTNPGPPTAPPPPPLPQLQTPAVQRRNLPGHKERRRRCGMVIDSLEGLKRGSGGSTGSASGPAAGSGVGLGVKATKSWTDSVTSRGSTERGSYPRLGARTPNTYDDITPITRGEWGILMTGDGRARTAVVETW